MYGGAPELTSWDASEAEKTTAEVTYPEVTLADLYKNFAKYVSCAITLKAVTFTDGLAVGDRNGKVSQGSDSMDVYAKVNSVVIETGAVGDLIAIPSYNGTKKQLGVWRTADFTPHIEE
jgi:hypothetical protein